MTYPTFELIYAPADATPEQIKEIVAANAAILDYQSKIEDIGDAHIDREKALLELEKQRLELARAQSYASRDVDSYRHRTGVFTLYDYVDDYSIKALMSEVNVWHNSAPEGVPLQLNINSYGGSVTDGFALFDTIRNVAEEGKRHVKTVSLGVAASMGGCLLQAGDTRVMTPSSALLIHEISFSQRGSRSSHDDTKEFVEILSSRIADVFVPRSTLSRDEFLSKFDRRDWWLSPSEALALGFVDRVAFS